MYSQCAGHKEAVMLRGADKADREQQIAQHPEGKPGRDQPREALVTAHTGGEQHADHQKAQSGGGFQYCGAVICFLAEGFHEVHGDERAGCGQRGTGYEQSCLHQSLSFHFYISQKLRPLYQNLNIL